MDINIVRDQRDQRDKRENIPVAAPRRRGALGNFFLFIFVILFLGALGAAGYFYREWHNLKTNPSSAAESENRALVAAVGKLILLPKDEQPTVATVTDPSKLASQSFFENAQAGYKVLVYSTAKKAILYDPSRNLIIEVGPISLSDTPETDGTVPTPPAPSANNSTTNPQ